MLTVKDIARIQDLSQNDKELADLFQKLEENQKFTVSKISHEIRNPVTLINSFLQLLESKNPAITQDTYWQKVMENMSFLRQLLDGLSTFNNSDRIVTEDCSPYRLLCKVIDSVSPTLNDSNINIQLIKLTPIPTIALDMIKMEQVFLNLIRNAKEALDEKSSGLITISIESDCSDVTIKISDNGSGIPPEYMDDLFVPFTTHKKDGTGLGLTICKRVIEAHSGTISVTSGIDAGSTFSIILPIL